MKAAFSSHKNVSAGVRTVYSKAREGGTGWAYGTGIRRVKAAPSSREKVAADVGAVSSQA